MEERVRQFNEDARKSTMQTANKGKAIKEIERLRRFLHTNQNFRFTEADKNNLYSAIEAYRSMFSSPSTWQGLGTSSPALPLLEDALKLPFTVFTTKQKQKFLKWYDELNAKEASASAQPQREKEMRYQVVDVEKNNISLMDPDSGEVQDLSWTGCPPEEKKKIVAAFEEGNDAFVVVRGDTVIRCDC